MHSTHALRAARGIKYGALQPCLKEAQILEETIKTRWNVLPEDQQKGIRQFLSNVIISVATSAEYAKHRIYLHKLNLVLVQVRCLHLRAVHATAAFGMPASITVMPDAGPTHYTHLAPETCVHTLMTHRAALQGSRPVFTAVRFLCKVKDINSCGCERRS